MITRYSLLLALNGIISAASDRHAAEIMLERTEALRKRIKEEPEPLAVVKGWMWSQGPEWTSDGGLQVGIVNESAKEDGDIPVTVTITEREVKHD